MLEAQPLRKDERDRDRRPKCCQTMLHQRGSSLIKREVQQDASKNGKGALQHLPEWPKRYRGTKEEHQSQGR